jgi:hypothetical protein
LNDLRDLLTDKRWFFNSIRKKYSGISHNQTVKLNIAWGMMRLPLKNEVMLASLLVILLLASFGSLVFTYGAIASISQTFYEMGSKPFYSVSVPLVIILSLGLYYSLRLKTSLKISGIKRTELQHNKYIDIAAGQIVLPPFARQFNLEKSSENTSSFLNPVTLSHQNISQIKVKWYQYHSSREYTAVKQNQIHSFDIKLYNGQTYQLNSWAFPYSSLLYLLIKFNYPVVLEEVGAR